MPYTIIYIYLLFNPGDTIMLTFQLLFELIIDYFVKTFVFKEISEFLISLKLKNKITLINTCIIKITFKSNELFFFKQQEKLNPIPSFQRHIFICNHLLKFILIEILRH